MAVYRERAPRLMRLPWGVYVDPRRILAVVYEPAVTRDPLACPGNEVCRVVLECHGGTFSIFSPEKDRDEIRVFIDLIIEDLEHMK